MAAEITKPKMSGAAVYVPTYIWVLLATLGVLVYFYGLTIPFLGPDEPRYAQVAREMFDRCDWVTPTLGGFPWFEKPALLYWLEMAAYKLFGVSEFAARSGPALFGLGTIVSLWILGKHATEHAKESEKKSPSEITSGPSVRSAVNYLPHYLALIAASTLGILVFSHGASFDIIITFPMTAALVGYFIFDQAKERSFKAYGLPLLSFYFFIGVSLLAKGLIGIIFPFAIVAFYHVLSWKMPSRAFVLSLFWGTALAVGIACIWYVPVYLRNGSPFVEEFFIQHHFQRFTSNKFQHPQPFYFFLWILPLMTLPWLPLFIAAIWNSTRERFGKNAKEVTEIIAKRPLLAFSVAWIAVPLVFFSISGSKLPGYILPAVPGAVVIAGIYAARLAEKCRAWTHALITTGFVVFLVTLFLMATIVPRFADSDSAKTLITAANDRGYTTAPVFNMHTISHSAEFYAAGRLLRDPDGKLKKLYGTSEVISEMQRADVKTALVIVPVEYQKQLTESNLVRSEILKDNGELAMIAVSIP